MRTWLIVPFSALLATSAHAAGPEAGRFSMSVIGGVDMPIDGDVHDGTVANIAASLLTLVFEQASNQDAKRQQFATVVYELVRSYGHQADLYMVKPFHTEHLQNALQSVLSIDLKDPSHTRNHYFINNRFVPFTAHNM